MWTFVPINEFGSDCSGGFMHKRLLTATAVLMLALPVIAQDAVVGKEYDITIQTEENNQYTGPYGEARVGMIAFDVPNAKKTEKYHVKVSAIAKNQYTGNMQASCDYTQVGGNAKGMCIDAP
jgi:hypothetical protein